jgi:CAAX protease family protein
MDGLKPSYNGNSCMKVSPATNRPATDLKITVITFVILTFLFSSVFWYLTSQTPLVKENLTILMLFAVGAMWGPALAAIATRLIFQRNLRSFGFGPGKPVWIAVGMLLPVVVGLIMFGIAWTTGIAPFSTDNTAVIFSVTFIPAFLFAIAFNCFAAAGEEIGWRGFLVPELARGMGFTKLALISGAIWTVWHFPMMFFGSYHGAGSIWYSLAVFIPSVMGAGLILAWLRLASGSVWVAVLFHGFWNYFIQQLFPVLTTTTDAGQIMLGEFGWFVAVFYVALALVFWHFRDRLPKLPAEAI